MFYIVAVHSHGQYISVLILPVLANSLLFSFCCCCFIVIAFLVGVK